MRVTIDEVGKFYSDDSRPKSAAVHVALFGLQGVPYKVDRQPD